MRCIEPAKGITPRQGVQERLAAKLEERRRSGNLRQLPVLQPGWVDFASNDYLGHARSGSLQEAAAAQAAGYGLGATGARLLTGNSALAMELEGALAQAFKADAALLFNSGFTLNSSLLQAICERDDTILMDELAHASLKDGLRLAAAPGYYLRHNDCDHLAERLRRLCAKRQSGQIFVVVESIYSMDGDIAPLAEMAALCQRYDAALIVDEAHALGTYGAWGEGLVSALGLESQIFARILTFGKGLGAHGAAVLGSELLIRYLTNYCHAFIYTTALPPHALAALLQSLRALREEPAAYEQLQHNIAYFNKKVLGITEEAHPSPIYSFVCTDTDVLQRMVASLHAAQLHVLPIYSPTVRRGQERLRVCLHSFNTDAEIAHLGSVIKAYEGAWQQPVCNRH